MTDKQTLPPSAAAPEPMPAAPEPMPAEGGSYIRLPDGSLQPAATDADTTKD